MDIEGTGPPGSAGDRHGKCYDAPEAPTFYPTSKEFVHPGRYIASIAEAVRPFGICKIVPPSSWKPPFMIDKHKFHFRTKVQQVNYLDGQSRLRLTFVENLCRFLAKQGTPLGRLPVVNDKVLDLCRLFSEVRKRGGMISVTEQKQWSEVARTLNLKSGFGATLKQHYERILFCYELYKASEAEKKQQEAIGAASDNLSSEGHSAGSANPAEPEIVEGECKNSQNARQTSVSSRSGKHEESQSDAAKLDKPEESASHTSNDRTKSGEKARSTATDLGVSPTDKAKPASETTNSGQSGEDDGSDSDSEFEFGYHDGQRYSLASYKAMADAWKSKVFGKGLGSISERDVEDKYWDVVLTPEDMVEVEYGSELHTTTHGSGFPTSGNTLNPLDQPHSSSSYCRSPWNLNNLNASTLLRHIRQDIPGILSPWVYVGMCMSSFCWHNEDHYLYSINYLWDGEPKQWYGCSGDDADAFEAAMREYAPELFEMQPDLLFQLVTMMSPAELETRGVKVCRMTQRAGEFMLTFPRAYHGGFNVGYNVAESCNFALTDWIPWGRASDLHYRKLCRPQVFSHPGFLVNLAEDDEDVGTALWLLPDLLRYYEEEAGRHQELIQKGLTRERAMDLKRGGILTTALLDEEEDVSNEYLDGKRVCKSRMQRVNKSMQDIRRAKQESAVADECAICKASTFFFSVQCSCSTTSVSCVEHAEDFCSCPLSNKLVEVRFTMEELEELVEEVRERAQQPSQWMDKARRLLSAAPQPLRVYHSVASEADKFDSAVPSVAAVQEELREELRKGRSWAARAQELLHSVAEHAVEQKGKEQAAAGEPEFDVSDLEKLEQEGKSLQAVPEEKEEVEQCADKVREWRARVREALPEDVELETLQGLLSEGQVAGVRLPEVKRLQAAVDMKAWLHAARPLLESRARIDEVENLVRDAHQKALSAPEVDAMKSALEEANTVRFKLAKAKERGTGLVALRQLLEKAEEEFGGMVIEIPEVEETKERIRRCEDWSARTKEVLSTERPLLLQLEKLAEEYSTLGAYVEPFEALRARLGEGTTWLRKTRRLVGDEMLVGLPESAGEGAEIGDPSEELSESAVAMQEDGVSKKRPASSAGGGVAAKKAKKEGATAGSSSAGRCSVSLEAAKEQLEEEKKLRVQVTEARALAQRVERFAVWEQSVLQVVKGACTEGSRMLAGLKEEGERMGFELGTAGCALEEYTWRARVLEVLAVEARDGQQLATMQEEGRQQGWTSSSLDLALEEEIRKLKETGCFCRRVGVNGKLSGSICCKDCGKTFHPECLCVRKGSSSAKSAQYSCAGCQRQARQRTHLELPAGWQRLTDAAGRSAFVNSFTGQGLRDPPPGTRVRTTPGLLAFEQNPCMARGTSRAMCQVCFQDDTDMVECAECGLRVHPSCYGEDVSAGSAATWLCKSCEYGVKCPDCPLCPLVGGAVKPALSGGWAHVVCATWVPEVFFETPERMEPIGGIDQVPKDRRRIPCCVCKTRKGAIIQCGAGKCSVSWHPLCGMEAGMYMNLEEDENGDVMYVIRCERHKPVEEDEEEDESLYCLCQQRYVEGEFMIECEGCDGWFHPKCVGLSEQAAEQIEHWKCPPCLGHAPPAAASVPTAVPAPVQVPQLVSADGIPQAARVEVNQSQQLAALAQLHAVQATPLVVSLPPSVGGMQAIPAVIPAHPLAVSYALPGLAPGIGRV